MNKQHIFHPLFVLMIISFVSVNHVVAMDDHRDFDQYTVARQILDNEGGRGVQVTASAGRHYSDPSDPTL